MSVLKKKSVEDNEVVSEYMNEAEKEVLTADGEQYTAKESEVSSERMNKVIDLLQEEFAIKDKNFEIIGYTDKGNKIIATVSNPDYTVSFTLNSSTVMRLDK